MILLTRATVETSAALWYLSGKIESVVTSGNVGDVDDYLMLLSMGSRSYDDMPQAISVMPFFPESQQVRAFLAYGTSRSVGQISMRRAIAGLMVAGSVAIGLRVTTRTCDSRKTH